MEWLKSKTTIVAGSLLALIGLQGYGIRSMRSMESTMEQRVGSMEREFQSMQNEGNAKLLQLSSDLDAVSKHLGITTQELAQSQTLAEKLRQENAQMAQRLRREMAAKADSKAVLKFHDEATSKLNETSTRLNEVQQEATTKFAGISGEVQVVKTDLDATREELANSRRDLGTLIARNSTELAELRRMGERDYIEFDIRKSKQFARVGDVLVQLKKTDVKRQKYEVILNVDDREIQKKDRTANEPVTFLVGRDSLRYEFVVNSVDKDRIRGYLSTPKGKLIAAETPAFRRVQ